MDYNEIVDRVNTFHEVLNTTQNRDKVLSSEEKTELKETIMAMSAKSYAEYKQEHDKTKHMNSIEYQAYKTATVEPVEEKVFYDGRRNNLSDFNLDQNSIKILSNPSTPVKKNLDAYKDDKPSNVNLKI